MTPQFSTTTLSSFHLFLTNWIEQRGAAYTNTTTRLYYQPDSQLPGFVAYASPFRSWVCDSGVSGAAVCSAVSGSLGLGGTGRVNRGQSGMMIDYENGRVLFPSATVSKTAIISGTYAFKDFNIYKANESQETLVFTNHYYLNSRFAYPITGAPAPYSMVTPCVFISDVGNDNKPHALGGVYRSNMNLTLTVMAETMNQLEGVLSLVSEAQDVGFPMLPLSAWPLNFYGEYKGGSGYNYEAVKAQYGTPSNLYFIQDVKGSKMSDRVKIDEGIFVGILDLQISKTRTLR